MPVEPDVCTEKLCTSLSNHKEIKSKTGLSHAGWSLFDRVDSMSASEAEKSMINMLCAVDGKYTFIDECYRVFFTCINMYSVEAHSLLHWDRCLMFSFSHYFHQIKYADNELSKE